MHHLKLASRGVPIHYGGWGPLGLWHLKVLGFLFAVRENHGRVWSWQFQACVASQFSIRHLQ